MQPITHNAVVVVPTYNEAANIVPLLSRIQETIPADIIVVDDSSPDGTGEVVADIASTNSSITLLRRTEKLGLASAYVAGFLLAVERGYQYVIQMDSDFSHDPAHLRSFLELIETYDLVIGSKYVPGGRVQGLSWWRGALSRYGNLYARTILHARRHAFRIFDTTSGYGCWRADLLKRINLPTIVSQGYGFQIEMKWRAVNLGARTVELPILFRDRVNGQSKMRAGIIAEAVLLPIRLAFSPLGLNAPSATRRGE